MIRWSRRINELATLAVALGCLVASVAWSAPAEAAATSQTLTVTRISGAGKVTNAEISCTGTAQGTTTGTCSHLYPPDCDYSGTKPVCVPPEVTVSAEDLAGSGFTFDHWTGACADTGSSRECDVFLESSEDVGAVFRDNQAPTVTLNAPSPGSHGGTIALAASASDNVAVTKVEFRVGNVLRATVTTAPWSASFDTTTVPDGDTPVTATAYDSSGLETTSSTVTVTVDNTAPTLVVNGPDGQTYGPGSTQTWTLAAADPTSGVASIQCSVVPTGSAPSYGACMGTSSYSVSDRPEGSYVFNAQATDQAGNQRDVTRTFTIDATPPDTSITSGPADGAVVTTRSVSFGLASTESGTEGCRLYASGTTAPAFAPCTTGSSFTAGGLADGAYVFEAAATDAVGNTDSSPVTRRFTVDATAPTLAITKQPQRLVKTTKAKAKASFAFSSEAGATFRCTLDGRSVGCGPTVTLKVKAGRHTLSVVAVDAAGNSSTPATLTWKVKRVRKHR